MPEQAQLPDNGNKQGVSPSFTAEATSRIDIQALAEKVYRLMCEQVRLERVRGERPGYGHGRAHRTGR